MKPYISTAAAALALVGAIGLAYAQTDAQPANTDTTAQAPKDPMQPMTTDDISKVTTPPSAASANTTSISTSTDIQPTGDAAMTTSPTPPASTADTTTPSTEPAPQADRN